MKNYKNIYLQGFKIILSLILVAVTTLSSNAEVLAKKERVRMKLYYAKQPDGYKRITIGLTAGSGRNMHGVAYGEVMLTAVLNDSTIELTTLTTDSTGNTILYVEPEYRFPVNEEGVAFIEAVYDGNDQYRAASSELEIADIDLTFSFDIEDSVKYLSVQAMKIDGEGHQMPVEELEIIIGVRRLYSTFTIDDAETDEDGVAVMEFPDDIPGDSIGMLTIVAKIDESDDFGTVEKEGKAAWGVPVSYEIIAPPRQLWTDEAPIWMIFAVFVVLLGAWYHFFLSVIKLRKIRKYAD